MLVFLVPGFVRSSKMAPRSQRSLGCAAVVSLSLSLGLRNGRLRFIGRPWLWPSPGNHPLETSVEKQKTNAGHGRETRFRRRWWWWGFNFGRKTEKKRKEKKRNTFSPALRTGRLLASRAQKEKTPIRHAWQP